MKRILTIGHSTHELEKFLKLLTDHGVTAIADVRSVPASRFTPQFNREALKRALRKVRVKYVFLGKELGARSDDPSCYVNGQVKYDRLARTDAFRVGVERLRTGMQTEDIALMCAEQEPLDCHRTLLVSRVLESVGVPVAHIHADGHVESHDNAMQRLMTKFGLDQADLLRTKDELLVEALSRQEQKVAYVAKDWPLSRALHG
ncbi:MAG: hypothetical protein JWM49_898 [Microbacteriaceae bacterium]|nr:hypothetical protein [Microbacteriaceae bacterium]